MLLLRAPFFCSVYRTLFFQSKSSFKLARSLFVASHSSAPASTSSFATSALSTVAASQASLAQSLCDLGSEVLLCSDLSRKVALTAQAASQWFEGSLSLGEVTLSSLPLYPGRPPRPVVCDVVPSYQELQVSPSIHLLHALAHIELTAVDMYWDTMLRAQALQQGEKALPREFFDDFMRVVSDEARHFKMVSGRLEELGSHYGALPAHRLLWDFGVITANDLAARIALVPLVQEARGLDAGPRFVARLTTERDEKSVSIVKQIVHEETSHVNMGVKWFNYLSKRANKEAGEYFRELVLKHIPTGLVPPFNEAARATALFPKAWYTSCLPPSAHPKKENEQVSLSFARQPSSLPSAQKPLSKKRVLLVFPIFPEFHSTAAGVRSTAIVQAMHAAGHSLTVVSPGRLSASVEVFRSLGIRVKRCAPNDPSFDALVTEIEPQIAIFDRFTMEEQFAWRVRKHAPHALLVLDTQDLHFLRHARELEVKRTNCVSCPLPKIKPTDENMHREIASILRSDLVLLVSVFEVNLLAKHFCIDVNKLALCTFFYPCSSMPNSLSSSSESASSSSFLTRPSASSSLSSSSSSSPPPSLSSSSPPPSLSSSSLSSPSSSALFTPLFFPSTKLSLGASFDKRKHFMTIGNFFHKPNVDAIVWLKESIWPYIRKQIPLAEMHVYGAYAQQKHTQLSNKNEGFFVYGHTPDQFAMIAKHRVLLAPLRFGAGIKGKIADAWFVGTPVVTTSIGAESMGSEEIFGGLIEDEAPRFADAAVRLFSDEALWTAKQGYGADFVQKNYDWNVSANALTSALDKASVPNLRSTNFLGGMLQGETIRTSEYLSKYIEASHKVKKLQEQLKQLGAMSEEIQGPSN